MTDVLIVGAGPAGLSASISCARYGMKVKILDEFVKPGGRLLGQLHQEPDGTWWNGIREAELLHGKATKLGVDIELGVSVYQVRRTESGWHVYTSKGDYHAPYLLLATGSAEWPVPVPGWTLPGVMSIGAAQVMTNVHRVKAGGRGLIIGINVLSAAIAREILLGGSELAAIVLPARMTGIESSANPRAVMGAMSRVAHLAPSPLMKVAGKFIKYDFVQSMGVRFFPRRGIKVWGVPLNMRKAAVRINGETKVESVRLARVTAAGEPIPGTEEDVPVDFVCISGGLYPLAELASVAGNPFRYVPELGGHVPVHNERMQTLQPGLYVSGNITGIENAKVAMAQGTVAGLSIAADSGAGGARAGEELEQAVRQVGEIRKRSLIHFHPNVAEGRLKMEQYWQQIRRSRQESP